MIVIVKLGLPPSSNQAYFNHPSGGRALTKAGTAYKKDVTNYIVKNHATQTGQLKKDKAVGMLVALGFTDLFNKGWPKTAKTRYKRIDLDNRYKLLQDAIFEATAIDDSQICFDFHYKYAAEEALTTIYIWNEEEEPIGQRLLSAFGSLMGPPPELQPNRAVSTV